MNPSGSSLFHRLSRELDAMFKGFGIEALTFDRMPTTWNPTMEKKGNEFTSPTSRWIFLE